MLIFWESRLVFLATPKAGSTAVEAALEALANVAVQRPAALKHANLATYQRHIAPWLHSATGDHFTTVALMREPVDWLRSWYRFYLRDEQDAETPDNSRFEDFVRLYLAHPESVTQGIGTQSAFLTAGDAPVDRIFRYEDMDAFTHFLDEWLDCAINLPRINVPPSADVTLSPATEAELRQALAPDFRLYATLS